MAKYILIFNFLFIFSVQANLLDFDSISDKNSSGIDTLVIKMKSLDIKDGPKFEETFNQIVREIETMIENQKLYCSSDSTNNEGKTLPASQKQYCMRELKKKYVDAIKAIFEVKKKYLSFIHERQIDKLNEIQNKMESELDKSF